MAGTFAPRAVPGLNHVKLRDHQMEDVHSIISGHSTRSNTCAHRTTSRCLLPDEDGAWLAYDAPIADCPFAHLGS